MNDDNDKQRAELQTRLKAKIWCSIENQVKEELQTMNSGSTRITVSNKFINSLMELCYLQLDNLGSDLERFAHHAGRETITQEDMMLFLRKTPILQEMVSDITTDE
ncbi:hypothetical protein NCAS_0B05400 [Naumovozyma castellii]|uniref:MHF histone-fold complex subunit 1 n=1 Tax=Naumovozyma castellii TaxID=27288 RepID=G0V9K8_NAUCA|nr:hypothetical protein NCAS_0B05400 [Naumovozyma castellii CBS 4309]CCC68624.1 hypothetical protein NCAS_0B05400 [Naumovozyma castellii CBS 4309]